MEKKEATTINFEENYFVLYIEPSLTFVRVLIRGNNILEVDDCIYSLRTDKLTLSEIKNGQKNRNSLFTVKDIEFLGNSVSVTVSDLKKSNLKANLSDKDFYKHEFKIGQNVNCKWSKTDLHKLE